MADRTRRTWPDRQSSDRRPKLSQSQGQAGTTFTLISSPSGRAPTMWAGKRWCRRTDGHQMTIRSWSKNNRVHLLGFGWPGHMGGRKEVEGGDRALGHFCGRWWDLTQCMWHVRWRTRPGRPMHTLVVEGVYELWHYKLGVPLMLMITPHCHHPMNQSHPAHGPHWCKPTNQKGEEKTL